MSGDMYGAKGDEGSNTTAPCQPTLKERITLIKELIKNTTPSGGNKKSVTPSGGLMLFGGFGAMEAPSNHYDLIMPQIWLGDRILAEDKAKMKELGITHVLNTAQGKRFSQVDTSQGYYKDCDVTYLGINATDIAGYNLSQYFPETSDFIDSAVKSEGVIYIHCNQGISRSTSILCAYLMMKKSTTLQDAVVRIRQVRSVFPNDGFLKQLCKLEDELRKEGILI